MKLDAAHFEEGLFAGALALPPGERAAFVERACGGDVGLCRRIEALLRKHEQSGGPLDEVSPGERAGLAHQLLAQAPPPLFRR